MIDKNNLHKAAQYLKQLKVQIINPLPHEAEYALFFSGTSITTGLMNNNNEIKIDLLRYTINFFIDNKYKIFSLFGGDLNKEIIMLLEELNLQVPNLEFPDITKEEIENYLPFGQLSLMVLESYRQSLDGEVTLIHLWGHNFDMDVVEYLTEKTEDNYSYQIGVGISPGDSFKQEPYIYLNAWPFAKESLKTKPAIGDWVAYSEDRYGLIIDWSKFENKPANFISDQLISLKSTLHQNFKHL